VISKKQILLLLSTLFALLLAGFVYWAIKTDAGRDFALRQVQTQLPAGAQLKWKSVQGNIADGLQFNQLSYEDSTLSVEAKSIQISLQISPLLFSKVFVDKFSAEHVRIYMQEDKEPFEFPRWPESLPALDMPFSLKFKQLNIKDLQFFTDNKPVYALNTLAGGFYLEPGSLQFSSLVASSEQGSIKLHGYYQPNHGYATKLQGGVTLNAGVNAKPQLLHVTANGDAKRFVLDVKGAMPEPISIRWQLQDLNQKPFWFLSASTERFEPRYLGFVDEHAYRVQLAATGSDKSTQIAGELSRDAQTIVINPSTLSLDKENIQIDKLQILYGGGTFTATGSVHAGEVISSNGINLTIKDFALPFEQQEAFAQTPVVLNSQLTWSGNLSEWKLRAKGDLLRAKELAEFSLSGTGGQESIRLSELSIKTAKGGLAGKLQAQWQPTLEFVFNGELKNFDPSYFYPDYAGAIDAALDLDIKQLSDKPWQGKVIIKKLGGQLRGRSLAGDADIAFNGLNISGNADLKIGGSHLLVKGSGHETIDVAAEFKPLNLNDINPQWTGTLSGSLALKGNKLSPDYAVAMIGNNIHIQDYQASTISLRGDTLTTNRTQLIASDLLINEQSIQQVELELVGKLSRAQIQASVQAEDFSSQASGLLQWLPQKQSLTVNDFQIEGNTIKTWLLQQAVTYEQTANTQQFTPVCLVNKKDSGRICIEDGVKNYVLSGQNIAIDMLEPWFNNSRNEFAYVGLATVQGELSKDFSLKRTGFIDLVLPSAKIAVKPNVETEVGRISDVHIEIKWLGDRVTGKLSAALKQDGYVEGEMTTGFTPSAPLEGRLKVQIYDLSWLELFSLDISQPKGLIIGEVDVSGTRGEPLINGSYNVKDLSFQIPALGLKLNDGQITAKSNDNLALLVKGSIKSGEGRMIITGLWDPADQLPQPINLRMRAKDFTVADTPDMQFVADSDVILTYEKGIYTLDGSMDLLKGMINLESINTTISISNDVVIVDPEPEKVQRDLLKLTINLAVTAEKDIAVKGFGMDGFATGKLTVRSPYNSATKLTGNLSLLGKFETYGQKFQIKKGNLIYNNDLASAPRLDILTERYIEAEDITVGLEITGSAVNPKTSTVSNPSMSDSEALSWLLFGQGISSVSASQVQSINSKSIALNAGGNLLVGSLGNTIGLDQASITESRALGESTLTIGKQISPKFFVSYGVSLLGIGQIITLKYLLMKGLDITIDSEQTENIEQSSAALNWRK
jgi:translocation and assembly module TamB